MKKLLYRIAACTCAAVVAVSVCGCKGGKDSGGKSDYDFNGMTITVADPWGRDMTPGVDEKTNAFIDKVKAVEKKYNVKFEWKKVDAGTYWNDMATKITGGDPFGDIIYSFPWMITDWIKAGAVKDISRIAESAGIDFNDGTWSKTVLEEHTYNNAIYGFSKEDESLSCSLLYNKRLFREAGLTDPNELIANGKKWDIATMEEYARKLTVRNSSTGQTSQWGLSGSDPCWLMTNFILSNGGSIVDYNTESGIPSFTMGSAKSLEGLDIFNRMLNTDQTIYFCPVGGSWDTTPKAFANGTVGMFHASDWLIEYVRDLMIENGTGEDYALTYFPSGSGVENYLDQSNGGSAYFIPTCVSDEKAKAALLVFSEIADKSVDGESKTDRLTNTAEALFSDEKSVEVYLDLTKDKIVRNGVCRVGLREVMMEIASEFTLGEGTARSIIEEYTKYAESMIEQSGYTACFKK